VSEKEILTMKKHMNRRIFLRGLGGAAVAAPFLSSVAEREAKAQSVPLDTPKRLIVLFTHYGCLTNRWFPTKSHGPLTKADYDATTLKHLSPYAEKLLMPRGIRAMNEWSFGGTYGQTTDPHTQVCGSFFTCQPVTPDSGKFDATPTGRSLDHVAAEQVDPSGKPLFMQIGGVRGSASNSMDVISYDAPGQMFPGYGSPQAIFSNLTNLFGEGTGGMSPDTYKVARGKSVIDVVRDDLNHLKRTNMSAADTERLNAWIELLHETGGEVAAQCTAETATGLGLTESSVRGAGNDLSKVTPVMMDLAVLSAICDSNRVIFMKLPGAYVFNFLGLNKDAHGLSHRIGTAFMGGACLDGVFDMIRTIDDWYAQQFAYLVGRLNSFDEGDVKLLDNTATVWFQELSDGNSHNLNNLPILQAGSCGGYFKVGQAVNVEDGSANMTVGNSENDCEGGNSDINGLDAVGTPPNIATQPINKYFCNLMNAIGVKAGADGFPAKNGTAPVTHYGKYDDTKLFKGGGTQPAAIKDPGEFTDLKANA
jgi:hypothetical protein